MDIIHAIYKKNPHLKRELLAAHMNISVYDFIKRSFQASITYTIVVTLIAGFVMSAIGIPLILLPAVPLLAFFVILQSQLALPRVVMKRRAREIDNEVLFAARFLLIKLTSGRPLFNALIETSQSYGVASKYFKEIVDDINFGTPIEQALTNAMEMTESRFFKKVLFQITNAIKIGVDVSQNLEVVIKEIEEEQHLEIEKYGKKLNSVALFYMLLAIIIPSLGMTLIVVVLNLVSFELNVLMYTIIGSVVMMIQIFFIHVFKSIRPQVNI
ncbi:MAG: type II secretion system F family protein [Candidatus Woesearchaeota archaeon]